MHRFRLTPLRAALVTVLFVALWFGLSAGLGGGAMADHFGWVLVYLIGLGWVVYGVERAARRIEIRRAPTDIWGPPLVAVGGEVPGGRRGGWNPLDPAAWYYGRHGQRLRQSLALLATYSLLFVLVYTFAHLKFGSNDESEVDLPAGGGHDSIKASSVKVQKVVKKKYVINPYSSIVFAAPPPLDQIDVKLTEETANRYQAGQGAGGLGEGEGEGGGFGSGTGKGKYQFVRLRHSDRMWDKNFGVGGDRNLLAEFASREPKAKVADGSESIDYTGLANTSAKKPIPLVYVGGAHTFAPSAAEKKILQQYLIEKHGMILGDNLGGQGFHGNFIAVMTEVTGVSPVPIPRDDYIHQRPYPLPQLPIVVAHGGTTPLGWKIDGRWAVYYHPGALSDAWRDDRAGIKKEIAELCYQLGINILYYANREQDKWRLSQKP
ncbi:MAG: hypothetical protein JWO38_310 [Gemmataceae bacterium]|nr:hypothetical protein [Gemmataceae bacterium]